eukprot:1199456-Amphidinium_carterae.2
MKRQRVQRQSKRQRKRQCQVLHERQTRTPRSTMLAQHQSVKTQQQSTVISTTTAASSTTTITTTIH